MDHQITGYHLFREEGYPTIYSDLSRTLWIDVTLFRICALFCLCFISFLCILPGFRGITRLFVFIRWTITFAIGLQIILCNLMPYWEVGYLDVQTPYRAGSSVQINATIGLKIGLRGINITMKGLPTQQHSDIIDYNEQFTWTWLQGKSGFGYDAGKFNKQYRQAQLVGLPYPILWVAETFTIDIGEIRIGRYYRQSGWFAHIFLWLAVPLFILANILFQLVIQYGSVFIILTGCSLLVANLIVTLLKSRVPFCLAFTGLHSYETEHLKTHYYWCYYANLINAIVCILIGLISLFADLRYPDETANFFGNDVLQSYEDYFADPQEIKNSSQNSGNSQPKSENGVLLRKRHNLIEAESAEMPMTCALKKRTLSGRFSRFQKSTIRKVAPSSHVELRHKPVTKVHQLALNQNEKIIPEDLPLYENYQQIDASDKENVEDNEV